MPATTQNPATSCNGCHAATAPPAPPASPDLPADFNGEARLEFLYSFLNPDIDHFHLAANFGLRLSQYHAYIHSDEFQQRLAEQLAISEMRAKACATIAQPRAIAALDHILTSYNETERNELPGRAPVSLNIRQRHRESARRAAWLILRISGGIPPALAARAKSFRETHSEPTEPRPSRTISLTFAQRAAQPATQPAAQPDAHSPAPTANSDPIAPIGPIGPTTPAEPTPELPTPTPAFQSREQAALARRAHEDQSSAEPHSTQPQPADLPLPDQIADSETPSTSTSDLHDAFDICVATALNGHLQPSGP
jgi:hypothetical protein